MSEDTGATPAPVETGAPVANTENTTTPPATPTANPAAEAKPKKDGGFQRRINELTQQYREAQRQNERLLSVLESQKGQQKEDEPPKPEQFSTLQEYMRAEIQYAQKQANKPQKQERSAERTGSEPNPDFSVAVNDLRLEGSDKYEDFQEKMDEAKYITREMAQAILELDELRVDVAMHLFNNQKEARRIASLSPMRQAVEIGKLEAKLSSAPPPKKPSSAPEPPTPVGGTASADSNVIKPQMDYKDFLKVRNKQLGRKQ